MLLRPAFEGFDVRFATSDLELAQREGIKGATLLPDTNRKQPLTAVRCLLAAAWLILRFRPHVIVTTGAAPGFMCVVVGRLLCRRTLWIDSVANAEELSGSGRLARRVATRVMTQWEHLALADRVVYAGRVL